MISDRFQAFVDAPNQRAFRRLQDQVAAGENYDPEGFGLCLLQQLIRQQRISEAREWALDHFADYLISPRFHYLRGLVAEGDRRSDDLYEARAASQACLKMLLATGDGSCDEPWRVTFTTDETDIEMVVGCEVRCRELIVRPKQQLDRVTAHDGQQLWFDVSLLHRALARQAGQRVVSNV